MGRNFFMGEYGPDDGMGLIQAVYNLRHCLELGAANARDFRHP
jgi:hypothetical protein